jgi:hypothetical protein
MNIARALANGGAYNLPYLLHLYDPTETTHIYLINDNVDFEYDGITYAASNFTYTPNNEGDSTLSVEIVEHDEIIDLLENNYFLRVEVIGIFNGEEVEEMGVYKHKYGEGTWDGMKLELKLNKDDRGEMSFPALTFNSYNNRGNN